MNPISVLREQLRLDTQDMSRLVNQRMFQNEQLESALFQGLQQHNRLLTWNTLPLEEEQLILLLSKARLAADKALAYALDPKLQAGTGFSREKTQNAQLLQQLSQGYYEEYDRQRSRVESADSESGDIFMGTLVRRSLTTHQKVPTQSVRPPRQPSLLSAQYLFNAQTGAGAIAVNWYRPQDGDLAYLRIYISQSPNIQLNDLILRTIYDLYGDVTSLAVAPYPIITPNIPRISQQNYVIGLPSMNVSQPSLIPTGTWYLAIAAFNWNMLYSFSPSIPMLVENYIEIACDSYAVEAAA
jgi:hypothetical protein